MKKIIAALSIFALGTAVAYSMQDQVKAEDTENVFFPSQTDVVNTGNVKALIVRVGYKDYPADESNPVYLSYDDKFLRVLFEGREDGFGLPYNGFSDYLYTSSYGKLSMSVGDIIDIQLDNTVDSYYNEAFYEIKSINFYKCQEFLEKLNEQITLSDYDKDGDGYVDALYVWDMSGNKAAASSAVGEMKGIYDSEKDKSYNYLAFYLNVFDRDYEKYCLYVLIHETGHLLLDADDYYSLENAPFVSDDQLADIGNVHLSYCFCDYDGWSKYKGGWLTSDNVSTKTFQGNERGMVSLTPYDSDSDDGKKLAILHDADSREYIVVDYCGGNNNNQLDTDLRKEGFRFYKCSGDNVTKDIVYGYDKEGQLYQLFNDEDELEIEFSKSGNKLKIYDIQTGDNPSFKYEYYGKFELEGGNSLYYYIRFADEEGRTIRDDDFSISQSIQFEIENQPDSYIFNSKNSAWDSTGSSYIHYLSNTVKDIITKIKNIEVPEGYKEISDIQLKFSDNELSVMGSDESNVVIDDTSAPEWYKITIKLEKEPVEDDTEQAENNNQNSTDATGEEMTEPSGESVQSESETEGEGFEEVKKQETDNEKTTVLSKEESLTGTINKKTSGNYSEGSLVLAITKEPAEHIIYPTNNQAPKTGDNNFTTVWITLAGTAAGVLTTAVALRKKNKIK